MNRRLYLEFSRGYWFAVRHTEEWTDGERKIRKRRTSLGIKGKEKRRQAERAIAVMEREAEVERPRGDATTADVLARFLDSARASSRPVTVGNYERWITAMTDAFGHIQAEKLTHETVTAFLTRLSARYSPGTVNACITPLRAAFRRALRTGEISRDPTDGLRRMDNPRDASPAYWTPEHFARFVGACPLPRLRAAYGLAFYAGLRAGEIVRLEWRDVLQDRLLVMSRASGRTKTGAQRAVPICPALRVLLDAAPRKGPYVVAGKQGGMSSKQNLSTTFGEIRASSGLPPLTVHGLRHSFATNLAIKGVPIQHIQRLLGHADIASTMIYAHPSTDAVVAAVGWAFEEQAP